VLGDEFVDSDMRRQICSSMLDQLDVASLPGAPHMLCHAKLLGLRHGHFMSDEYVDLFWFLFAEACGFRHHTIDRNCQDLRFPTQSSINSPLVIGSNKDLLSLHGVYLNEMIMLEGTYTDRFQRQFDRDSRTQMPAENIPF